MDRTAIFEMFLKDPLLLYFLVFILEAPTDSKFIYRLCTAFKRISLRYKNYSDSYLYAQAL